MLVDANQHVDREAAARSGVGFYGKNTMLITRRHGSWVVLGTVVTDARARADAARSTLDCGECRSASTRARPARSTSRARSTRRAASPTGRRRRRAVPEPYRDAPRRAGLRLRHLPGRVPVEPRHREAPRRRRSCRPAPSRTSRSSTGSAPTPTSSRARYDRLFVPRNDARWLQRNALVAAGNVGGAAERDARRSRTSSSEDDDAARARGVGAATDGGASVTDRRAVERWIAIVRLGGVVFAMRRGRLLQQRLPSRATRRPRGCSPASSRVGRDRALLARARARATSVLRVVGFAALALRHGGHRRVRDDLLVRVREPDALGGDLRGRRGGAPLRPRAAASRSRSLLGGFFAFNEWWRAQRVRAARVHLGPRHVPDRRRCC